MSTYNDGRWREWEFCTEILVLCGLHFTVSEFLSQRVPYPEISQIYRLGLCWWRAFWTSPQSMEIQTKALKKIGRGRFEMTPRWAPGNRHCVILVSAHFSPFLFFDAVVCAWLYRLTASGSAFHSSNKWLGSWFYHWTHAICHNSCTFAVQLWLVLETSSQILDVWVYIVYGPLLCPLSCLHETSETFPCL